LFRIPTTSPNCSANAASASRWPKSRFTSVDFPTFCRPTTATSGTLGPAIGELGETFADPREPAGEHLPGAEVGGVDHEGAVGRTQRVHGRVSRIAGEERSLDLKLVALALGAPRFSFGSAALLYEVLGVRPGSVTPFALANDTAHRVTVVLDRAMLEHDPLNYHPLENDRTTAIAPADLLRFIADCGHHPRIVDLDLAAPAA